VKESRGLQVFMGVFIKALGWRSKRIQFKEWIKKAGKYLNLFAGEMQLRFISIPFFGAKNRRILIEVS
jgi:hypothetical protein